MSIAVFPGTFDPITLGHVHIVNRGLQAFDKIIIACNRKTPKQAWFDSNERIEMLKEVFSGQQRIEIDSFDGLLVQYMQAKEIRIILRGIRTVQDYEYEFQMAMANHRLDERVETLFMVTDNQFAFVSSTLVKEIARLKGDVQSMVPTAIAKAVAKRARSAVGESD